MSEHLESEQLQYHTGDTSLSAPRKCGMCEIGSDFLICLQFGSGVNQASRLHIERYIKRVLRSSSKQGYEDTYGASRKRRRRDDAYDDSYYEDASSRRISRRRSIDEGDTTVLSETASTGSVLVIYDQAVGFDLDTTKDPEMEDGPRYERGTNSVLGVSSDSVKALGNPCFNCSMLDHELRSCPMPLDREAIEANRNAFKEKGQGQFNSRLYLVVEEEKRMEEMRQRIRPGQPLSQELREALGLERDDDVPEYVQSIYYHGYPPAYIGSTPDQDPLLAPDRPTTPVPSTPMLVVYSEDYDYVDESSADIEVPDTSAVVNNASDGHEADDRSSDEEGALSEGEVDSEPDVQGILSDNAEESRRNIPLVKYPGLDLAEFDFTSTTCPGRPLHSGTPRRGRPRGEDEYRYYDESQNGYYQDYDYPSQTAQNTYADPFSGMLDGYYRSSQQTAYTDPYWQHNAAMQPRYDDYSYYHQSPRHDARMYNSSNDAKPPVQPPPPLPSSTTEAQLDPVSESAQVPETSEQYKQNSLNTTVQLPIAVSECQGSVNEDVEDGECDMEESD
ncbi:hypothetical protein GGI03_003695 [Coemansia sp. RSA 2337]|nr:hypothetical protein GGI03_003695 [Coemansia sp. RSA 2337]